MTVPLGGPFSFERWEQFLLWCNDVDKLTIGIF